MKTYEVVLLGEKYTVKAQKPYEARRKASELYLKGTELDLPLSFLALLCRVKVSERDDGRISYYPGKIPKEKVEALVSDFIKSRLAGENNSEEENGNEEPEEY